MNLVSLELTFVRLFFFFLFVVKKMINDRIVDVVVFETGNLSVYRSKEEGGDAMHFREVFLLRILVFN